MNILSSRLTFAFIILVKYVGCAKILGIVWTHSRSHHILESVLLQALARKGHEVTILSPFKDDVNLTNYRQEQIEQSSDFAKEMTAPITTNIFSFMISQQHAIQKHSELFWKSPSVQDLIKSRTHYDVAIIMQFDNDAIMALAHHVGAPIIFLNSVGAGGINKYVGNPNLACYPCAFHLMAVNVRYFVGRLVTATMNALFYLEDTYISFPNQIRLLSKYLPDAPPLEEIQKNVSLVLLNSHISVEPPRCHVPNMIQIGGFHTQVPEKLPDDIQSFLDSAKHGAVLFSFGTNVKLGSIDKEKLQIFLKGISKITPVKVLLKSEVELPDVAENVLVKKWVPQNDVLAHPNIKAFISHGGLGGTTEAVFHGVPMLGIPFFGDQKANIASTAEAGYTYPLNYEDVTQTSFDVALKEVLWNKKLPQTRHTENQLVVNDCVFPGSRFGDFKNVQPFTLYTCMQYFGEESGVYQINCGDCDAIYIGQTGRNINTRVNEHKRYSDNMKKYSSLLKNQPIKPLDNAIWWIEHIIEHKGGKHLRNVAMDLTWFEMYMMDIMLFYLVVLIFVCISCFSLLRLIFLQIPREKNDKLKQY